MAEVLDEPGVRRPSSWQQVFVAVGAAVFAASIVGLFCFVAVVMATRCRRRQGNRSSPVVGVAGEPTSQLQRQTSDVGGRGYGSAARQVRRLQTGGKLLVKRSDGRGPHLQSTTGVSTTMTAFGLLADYEIPLDKQWEFPRAR